MPTAATAVKGTKLALKVAALVLVVASAATYMIALALGPVLFFSTSDGLNVASRVIQGLPIDIFMAVTIPLPLHISYGALFIAVWALFVACIVLAWVDRVGFLQTLRDALSKPLSLAKSSSLFTLPLVATALLSATVLIQDLQESEGVQTGGLVFPPATSPFVILMNLAFAPLREELAFRITSIGIPAGISLIILYRHDPKIQGLSRKIKLILLAMFSPELAKAKMGHKTVGANGFLHGITALEWVLILLTAAIFGLAHYLLGAGWEVGKISTAFLAGLLLAIMYVAYGAHAAILLHWFFNYYFTVLDMASSTFGGMFSALSNLTVVANLTAGYIVLIVFLLAMALKLADYLTLRAAGLKRGE